MAGPDPAIFRRTTLEETAGSSPAMTIRGTHRRSTGGVIAFKRTSWW
jgi:hypothetical protein